MAKAKLSKELAQQLAEQMKLAALLGGKGTVIVEVVANGKPIDIKFTIERDEVKNG